MKRSGDVWAVGTAFQLVNDCTELLMKLGTALASGALNARTRSLTGTMKRMGSSIVTKTTGGNLGNLAMAALC